MTEEKGLLIRDLPEEERPREKLQELGAGALSNAELLAILLRTGGAGESAVQLALRLLSRSGGLRLLPGLSLEAVSYTHLDVYKRQAC